MIHLLGVNHRSADVDLRERLAFPEEDVSATLERLLAAGFAEAYVLSTCNRVEVLVRDETERDTAARLTTWLAGDRGVAEGELREHGYGLRGTEAVRHLFRVAAGLDSMILGEPQILGQVRGAYRRARDAGTLGSVLDRLLQQALSSARRVRRETGISRHAVSVAFAAVGLARQIFGSLRGRSALVLGTGKMGELVARNLNASGIDRLFFAGRDFSRATAAAQRHDGASLSWEDALKGLARMDIVISCTAAPTHVLGRERVAAALRGRRGQPLLLVDIAMPRDVDPGVHRLDNVYLYDVDGLQGVVDRNLAARKEAATRAQEAIEADVASFVQWRRSLEATPVIVALRDYAEGLASAELDRFRARLAHLPPGDRDAVATLVRAVTRKFLHAPITALRGSAERGDGDRLAVLYREIFRLRERRDASGDGGDTGPRGIVRGGRDER